MTPVSSAMQTKKPKCIVHVVPYDGVGGVETAVRSMDAGVKDGIAFHKYFIANPDAAVNAGYVLHGAYPSASDPRNFILAVWRILRLTPDLVIASLWRSALVLLFVRLFRPRTVGVVFLHSSKAVHWLDLVLNRLAMSVATAIWTDSRATLLSRVPGSLIAKARVMSCLTQRAEAVAISPPIPAFIYWGRVEAAKGLIRALTIFAAVHARWPSSGFTIIGPDRGHGKVLRQFCNDQAIGSAVHFTGPCSLAQIEEHASRHSFYLQASTFEGMGMAVVEAMQFGLLPVVTPVGEIASYCRDGENSIVIDDDETAIRKILEVIADPQRFGTMTRAARATWQTQPLYRDDVMEACRSLLVEVS